MRGVQRDPQRWGVSEGMSDELNNTKGPGTEAPVPSATLRQGVASAAKELVESALALEQTALFAEEPFEEGLLLPIEEIHKRYTGKTAQQLEWRRTAALYMIARGCPLQDIEKILHMNHRVIAALASQNGRTIAAFSEDYAKELLASAAGDIALADTKKHEASYKDLHIGAGIKLTHAQNLKATMGAGDLQPVTDIEAENPALASARKLLESLKAKPQTGEATGGQGVENNQQPTSNIQHPVEEGKV